MSKILITGGAGFIGSNAGNTFAKEGHEVIAFDDLSLGDQTNLESGVKFVNGDVNKAADLDSVGPVDYIIHLASSSSAPMFVDNLINSVSNNVTGHMEVLEYARRVGAKKVLFASTSSIYGNNPIPLTEDQSVVPPNFYSVTKHAQEELSYVHNLVYGTEIIAFRFMSVYGLHEEHKGKFANLVSQFIWGMEQGKEPIVYGDGSQTRDLTNVRDIIQAFKLAMETEKKFGFTVFNVGTSDAVSMNDLINVINEARGTNAAPKHIDNPIKAGYIKSQQADLSKISTELGYKPTVTIAEGVKEIVDYRKDHPKAPVSLSY